MTFMAWYLDHIGHLAEEDENGKYVCTTKWQGTTVKGQFKSACFRDKIISFLPLSHAFLHNMRRVVLAWWKKWCKDWFSVKCFLPLRGVRRYEYNFFKGTEQSSCHLRAYPQRLQSYFPFCSWRNTFFELTPLLKTLRVILHEINHGSVISQL